LVVARQRGSAIHHIDRIVKRVRARTALVAKAPQAGVDFANQDLALLKSREVSTGARLIR